MSVNNVFSGGRADRSNPLKLTQGDWEIDGVTVTATAEQINNSGGGFHRQVNAIEENTYALNKTDNTFLIYFAANVSARTLNLPIALAPNFIDGFECELYVDESSGTLTIVDPLDIVQGQVVILAGQSVVLTLAYDDQEIPQPHWLVQAGTPDLDLILDYVNANAQLTTISQVTGLQWQEELNSTLTEDTILTYSIPTLIFVNPELTNMSLQFPDWDSDKLGFLPKFIINNISAAFECTPTNDIGQIAGPIPPMTRCEMAADLAGGGVTQFFQPISIPVLVPFADVPGIKLYPSNVLGDGMQANVLSLGKTFYYDSTSSAVADDVNIITPTSVGVGAGRWLVLVSSTVGTSGTYEKVTTDAEGKVISGTTLSASDIPALTAAKITDFNTAAASAAPVQSVNGATGLITGVEATANKDASNGYTGLTLFKINFKNVLNTFTSFFTNSNTAARTYTFQDRDGTIADNTDLATKQDAQTTGAITATWGGIFSTPVSGDINYAKTGKEVTLTFPQVIDVLTILATTTITLTTPLAAAYRPINEVRHAIGVRDNNADITTPGMIKIDTSGNVTVYKDFASANFGGISTRQSGFYGSDVTFRTA